MKNFVLLLFLFTAIYARSQTCTNLGQNPGTAFPVCGSSVFQQNIVPICGDRPIPTPCSSSGLSFQDKNPYWYKFTCFSAGTLAFVITPSFLTDDYDWQLFDVTGHDPDEVYTNQNLFVASNWSGEGGKTGASSAGTSLTRCGGRGVPLFSSMPVLKEGHNYLLLVSHFTNSQVGYTLDFSGGTASITDMAAPKMIAAKALCDGQRVSIKLNKKMKCTSLAADGSDFIFSSSSATVSSAAAASCSAGFDMDSVIVTLSNPLPLGDYTIGIKNGTDGNTLLDNCDASIQAGQTLSFTVVPSVPTTLDTILTPGCAPDEVKLLVKDAIRCNSVAADGSDFLLTGSSAVKIIGASTSCTNGLSNIITLQLSSPIYVQGNYRVTLQKGSDGNTLINECAKETPEGVYEEFTTKDTVSADFTYNIDFACKADTVAFFHNGNNGTNEWSWRFDNAGTSTLQNPVYTYPSFGKQEAQLTVSNGVCKDSATAIFYLDNELKAGFTTPGLLCPEDVGVFKDSSIGKIMQWSWDFGNGNTSGLKDPPAQTYPATTAQKDYMLRLIVKDAYGCYDTARQPLKVYNNCYIAVATAFTPNGDGRNEYLYPINAYKTRNLVFKVYNRFGQLLFETTDITRKWDGTFKGIRQATGTYIWTLQYIHTDTGGLVRTKGTTVLIR